MTVSHLNLRWSLQDMTDLVAMVKDGWDSASIGEAFHTSAEEIEALCERNRIILARKQRSTTRESA